MPLDLASDARDSVDQHFPDVQARFSRRVEAHASLSFVNAGDEDIVCFRVTRAESTITLEIRLLLLELLSPFVD